MNRIPREPSVGGRNIPTGSKQQFFGGMGPTVEKGSEEDENLALFSRIRQNQNTNSPKGSYFHNAPLTPERWKMGSSIKGRSKVDDLFSDSGKHDYDWLLTPPGTPLISPLKPSDYVPARVASRSSSNVSLSTSVKASRFSPSQSEKAASTRPNRSSSTTRPSISTTHSSTRPIRSSSTTRPSISTTNSSTRPIRSSSTMRPSISTTHSSSSSFHNIRTSALNTSSSSISSRPSTPGSRTSISVPSSKTTPVPASRAPPLRSSTPTRNRQPSAASGDKPRISQNSRPATPTARPRTPSNDVNPRLSAPASRPNSRPSTPTRRTPSVATAPSGSHSSSSVSRFPAFGNPSTGSASRSNSPAPRAQAPRKPVALPDFPLDAPPNLRTKLPERALSAGRQRPGLPLTVRSNLNSETTVSSSTNIRKSASPIVSRGRLQENPSVTRPNSSQGRLNSKNQVAMVTSAIRVVKPSSPVERTGLGRTISKYSMDTALKHMDIRKSVGSIRGPSLIPQSIRSATQRGQLGRSSDSAVSGLSKASHLYDSGMSDTVASDNDSCCSSGMFSDNFHHIPPRETIAPIRTDLKGNMNTFYDQVMLKEDPENMNWLHSTEDSLI